MKLFYSYSHKDENLRDEIAKHLFSLKEKGLIDEWHDRKIPAGGGLHKEIDTHLETSDIILLLLSADYLASPECRDEMHKAFELRKTNGTIVLPVIARPCAWKDEKMLSGADILAIPTDGKAITDWDKDNQAFVNIYAHIKDIVTETPFCLRTEFRKDLTQVEFISQRKNDITLDDIFVFPRISAEYSKRKITGFQNLWKKNARLMLKGDDRTGKTVVCRKLFLTEVENGTPTILISGGDVKSPINHEKLIEKKFQEQFSGGYSYWRNRQKKLLILDDFSHNTRPEFIDFAKEFFERIIIVLSEDEYLAYFSDYEKLADFDLLTLRSLGHAGQEKLIKRWVNLNNALDGKQEIPHGKIDQIEDSLNSIILHNRIVPRYPFYILSILQTFEAFMPQDLRITAYGHCYQSLITAQLINIGVDKEDIDSCFNFLTYFAFEIFERQNECSREQFEHFVKDYKTQYIIKDGVVNRLVHNDSAIIRTHKGSHEFNYPYIYYFFLGHFFARNYRVHENLIEQIAEKSYLQDNAYILIFTIHHTQDEDLIDTILIHTACAFDHACTATLSTEETKLLEGTLQELPEKILSNRPVNEERQLKRKWRDEAEADFEDTVTDDKSEEEDSSNEGLNDVYRALKNMEILGQILRNKYGSLPRAKIEEVIDFVTDAGLRLIKVHTDPDSIKRFEAYCNEVFKNENMKEGDKQRVERSLRKIIRTLVFLTIGSLLYKVVDSILKPELLEIVESMYQPKDTPAYDLLHILFLLNTSEELRSQEVKKITDTIRKFEKTRNVVARRLLSFAIQLYANTHEIHFKLREELFRTLKIKYKPNLLKKPS